jgi:hypothetical protein
VRLAIEVFRFNELEDAADRARLDEHTSKHRLLRL